MQRRPKNEQEAYCAGFRACARCVESYLSNEGKTMLNCLLMFVENMTDIKIDIEEGEAEE